MYQSTLLTCHVNPTNYHGNSELLIVSLFVCESPNPHDSIHFYSEGNYFFSLPRKQLW